MRLDLMESVYEAGKGLVGEPVRLALVSLELAEGTRDWSDPVRLRIVDGPHPGFVYIEMQRVEE